MPVHALRFTLPALALAVFAVPAWAQPLAPREAPGKTLAVPGTVSPQMQAIIAQPLRTNWDKPPTTPEGWKQLSDSIAATVAPQIPAMAERMRVKIAPSTLDGVRIYTITPDDMPPQHRNRLAVHVHGGCYVLNPREAALPEAIFMAGFARDEGDRGGLPDAARGVLPGGAGRCHDGLQGRHQDDGPQERGGVRQLGRVVRSRSR